MGTPLYFPSSVLFIPPTDRLSVITFSGTTQPSRDSLSPCFEFMTDVCVCVCVCYRITYCSVEAREYNLSIHPFSHPVPSMFQWSLFGNFLWSLFDTTSLNMPDMSAQYSSLFPCRDFVFSVAGISLSRVMEFEDLIFMKPSTWLILRLLYVMCPVGIMCYDGVHGEMARGEEMKAWDVLKHQILATFILVSSVPPKAHWRRNDLRYLPLTSNELWEELNRKQGRRKIIQTKSQTKRVKETNPALDQRMREISNKHGPVKLIIIIMFLPGMPSLRSVYLVGIYGPRHWQRHTYTQLGECGPRH